MMDSKKWSTWGLLLIALALVGCGVSSPLPIGSLAPLDDDDDADEAPESPRAPEPDKPDEEPPPMDDTSSGSPKPPLPCGTGPGCDATDLGGETCRSLGLGEGRLLCDPATCSFEVSLCTGVGVAPPCGTGEGCDPANLGGETCGTLGMGEGSLVCDPVTCTFDTSLCSGGLFGTGGTGGGDTGGDDAPATFGGVFGGGDTGGGDEPATFGGFFGGDDTGGDTGFFGGFFGGDDQDAGI
ncbi:MAG: hypothetical protein OXT09_00180 [Myxococcales bacterium]|nr:hypothetical protein [Myxococcales bacterium]